MHDCIGIGGALGTSARGCGGPASAAGAEAPGWLLPFGGAALVAEAGVGGCTSVGVGGGAVGRIGVGATCGMRGGAGGSLRHSSATLLAECAKPTDWKAVRAGLMSRLLELTAAETAVAKGGRILACFGPYVVAAGEGDAVVYDAVSLETVARCSPSARSPMSSVWARYLTLNPEAPPLGALKVIRAAVFDVR